MLFLQAQQCSALATYAAGAAGGLLSSLPALFGRLAFKYSRDARTRRVYKALSVARKEQFALGAAAGLEWDRPSLTAASHLDALGDLEAWGAPEHPQGPRGAVGASADARRPSAEGRA